MLDILRIMELFVIPRLVREVNWKSLFIDYHPPVVERLWTQFGPYRINLHKIHPCKKEDSLFHPHPWPSVMKILSGTYKMDVGYGRGDKEPPVACELTLIEGSSYSMTDPDGWHRIYPVERPSVSLMVTGLPWKRSSPGKGQSFTDLDVLQRAEILSFFYSYYPRCMINRDNVVESYLAKTLHMSLEDLQKTFNGPV